MAEFDNRTENVNHNSFSEITPESAYWIGLLMADGCIAHDRSLVQLHLIDEEHVIKFQKFTKCMLPVRIRKTGKRSFAKKPQYILRFTSNKIAEDLAHYGVIPRKSLIAEAKNGIENSRDFWRGVIDGNGVVGFINIRGKARAGISLSGSFVLLEQFRKFIAYNLPEITAKVYPSSQKKKLFQIGWTREPAEKIIRLLYQDSCESLKRKYGKAMLIMEHSKLH